MFSADGDHWGIDGSTTVSMTNGFGETLAAIGPGDARRALLYVQYVDQTKTTTCGSHKPTVESWIWANTIIALKGSNNPLKWGRQHYLDVHNTEALYQAAANAHPGWPIYMTPGEKVPPEPRKWYRLPDCHQTSREAAVPAPPWLQVRNQCGAPMGSKHVAKASCGLGQHKLSDFDLPCRRAICLSDQRRRQFQRRRQRLLSMPRVS
jgi:hypothetical protein